MKATTPQNAAIAARVTVDELEAFEEAAALSGLKLSAWIRTNLRQLAEQRLLSVGRKPPWLDSR
jgi:uncharacterized protein (DUF1778 family)